MDLAKKLEELLNLERADAVDANDWYARAREVHDYIGIDPEAQSQMTHNMWHYLSDLDIRFKDEVYAEMQRKQAVDFIAGLRASKRKS